MGYYFRSFYQKDSPDMVWHYDLPKETQFCVRNHMSFVKIIDIYNDIIKVLWMLHISKESTESLHSRFGDSLHLIHLYHANENKH